MANISCILCGIHFQVNLNWLLYSLETARGGRQGSFLLTKVILFFSKNFSTLSGNVSLPLTLHLSSASPDPRYLIQSFVHKTSLTKIYKVEGEKIPHISGPFLFSFMSHLLLPLPTHLHTHSAYIYLISPVKKNFFFSPNVSMVLCKKVSLLFNSIYFNTFRLSFSAINTISLCLSVTLHISLPFLKKKTIFTPKFVISGQWSVLFARNLFTQKDKVNKWLFKHYPLSLPFLSFFLSLEKKDS